MRSRGSAPSTPAASSCSPSRERSGVVVEQDELHSQHATSPHQRAESIQCCPMWLVARQPHRAHSAWQRARLRRPGGHHLRAGDRGRRADPGRQRPAAAPTDGHRYRGDAGGRRRVSRRYGVRRFAGPGRRVRSRAARSPRRPPREARRRHAARGRAVAPPAPHPHGAANTQRGDRGAGVGLASTTPGPTCPVEAHGETAPHLRGPVRPAAAPA